MGELKRCVWCQAYRITGELPLRRDMPLNSDLDAIRLNSFAVIQAKPVEPKVIDVEGGVVWRTDKGVLKFMCKRCVDAGMLAQISKFRKGFTPMDDDCL